MAIHTNKDEIKHPMINLFIGCGGTGFEVVRRIKSLYLSRLGKEEINRIFVDFLVIDTVPYQDVRRDPITMSEYIDLTGGGIVTSDVIGLDSRLRRGEDYLKDWWYEEWKNPPPIYKGASQLPPLGRLALFSGIDRLRNKINQKISNIADYIERLKDSGVSGKIQPNIFIIFSSAGGTGSGTYLDAGILMRWLLKDRGIKNPKIIGVMVSGDVFEGYSGTGRVILNTIKTMFELSRVVYSNEMISFRYPGVEEIILNDQTQTDKSLENPFDNIFYVSKYNKKGESLKRIDNIYELISETLFPIITTEAGPILTQKAVNVSWGLNKDNLMSSFGARSLIFPESDVYYYFTNKSMLHVINDFFLKSIGEKELSDEVDNLIATLNINEEGPVNNRIQGRLLEGEPVSLQFSYRDFLDRLKNQDITNAVNSMFNSNEEELNRLKEHMRGKIEELIRVIKQGPMDEDKKERVETKSIGYLLNQLFLEKGALGVSAILDRFNQKLNSFKNELNEEKKEFEAQILPAEEIKGEIEEHKHGFLGLDARKGYIKAEGLNRINEYFNLRFEVLKREVAVEFIDRLQDEVIDNLRRKYLNLTEAYKKIKSEVESDLYSWRISYEKNRTNNPVIERFLSLDEIEKLYELSVDWNIENKEKENKKFSLRDKLEDIKRGVLGLSDEDDIRRAISKSLDSLFGDWIRNQLDFKLSYQILYPSEDNKEEISRKGIEKMKERMERLITKCVPWFSVNTATHKKQGGAAAFIGPKDPKSAGIDQFFYNLIEEDLNVLATETLEIQSLQPVGVPQKPQRYFVNIIFELGYPFETLNNYGTKLKLALLRYLEKRMKGASYNDFPPCFISKEFETIAMSIVLPPSTYAPYLFAYDMIRDIGNKWYLFFRLKPERVSKYKTYNKYLLNIEQFINSIHIKGIEIKPEDLPKDAKYVFIFTNDEQRSDIKRCLAYINATESLKRDLDDEIKYIDRKLRDYKNINFKNYIKMKALYTIENVLIPNREVEDDVGRKRMWNEIINNVNRIAGEIKL